MVAAALKEGTDKELRALLELAVGSIGETLSSLVGRDIKVKGGQLQLQDPESVSESLPRTCAVARGAMDKGYAGKSMLSIIELPDAIAMAGLLMMTPEDVIAQRREKGELEGEDVEAFGELGNVLYSGFSNVLRDKIHDFDLRMHDHVLLEPGEEDSDTLGTSKLVTISLQLKIGEYPESRAWIAIDLETAEKWNKGPIEALGVELEPALAAGGAIKVEDDGLESIPAAPIRGTLSAFIIKNDVFRTLRRSCRRVGLELRRHGRGEIPNPAAHRDQVVVLDVPPGEDRRFDWCRRIKDLSESTKVVLLIHHASRARVTQAFLSRADAILGYPCEETQLSEKLDSLVPEDPPVDDEPESSDE